MFFEDVYIPSVASTGISKPPRLSCDSVESVRLLQSPRHQRRRAPLEIRNLVKRLMSRGR